MRRSAFSLFIMAVLLAACGGEDRAGVMRFSAIPDRDQTLLAQRFDPVARYLSEKLGVRVEYVPSSDYASSVEMFKNGDIQLAWFGGLSGVVARHAVAGAHAIVKGESDAAFHTYFIAHRSTGLTRSDEFPLGMKGMKFTFGSRGSTSGRLMPEKFIRDATGLPPEEFFGSVNFSGDHDKTAELVEAGTYQVGALNFKTYEARVKSGMTDPDVCRVIWKTPAYADYNFTAHPSLERELGAGFTAKLERALLEMTDPKLLQAFLRKKMIPADDREFEAIKQVAQQQDMLR
ncbi:MAG: putative selenate ABC transporter substrate-binding protein [Planctomycetota bacterium]